MPTQTILWIYCDELRADALGCYGGPAGLTPHLDALAEAGAVFTNAYCSSPVCVPSRTAAITGQLPTRTGVYHNEAAWGNFQWEHQPGSWLEDFDKAGWVTITAGKSHLPNGYQPFQQHYPTGGGMAEITKAFSRDELKIISPPGLSTMIGGEWPVGVDFPPAQVTQQCIASLEAHQNDKLLIRASYLQPHTPVTPPAELIRCFDHLEIPEHDLKAKGPSHFEQAFARNLGTERMSQAEAKHCWICYMALVHWVDIQVGELIKALKELGLYENTLICFTADHGAALGEDGLWAKQNFRRFNHQVPLIFSGPGIESGLSCDRLSDSTDLGVTFKTYTGMDTARVTDGVDILGQSASHDHLFSVLGYGQNQSRQFPNLGYGDYQPGIAWPRRACIRTQEWRYERNIMMHGKTFSINDPMSDASLIHFTDTSESNNRVQSNPEVVNELEALLQSHLVDSKEPSCELYAR